MGRIILLSGEAAAVIGNCSLDLNFNIHAGRQIQPHQRIDRLRIWIQHVDQPLVRADLKMLVRILVNKVRRTVKRSTQVGRGTGPTTWAPVRSAVPTMRCADWSGTR